MGMGEQLIWLVVLALPVASVAWTVTHEEVFREPREWCIRRSRESQSLSRRKLFYVFTCEYCFSHWVALFFLLITGFHLLLADWRGYLIALFALVWVANIYMNLYGAIRLDIRKERVEIQRAEQDVDLIDRGLHKPAA